MQWKWQFVAAVVLLLAFGVLTVLMLVWADGSPEEWKNRAFVFSSVEAIVFTAVGWLFGREVHREGVEAARKDAAEAKDKADTKQQETADERAKGMKLAGAVAAMDTTPARNQGEAQDVGLASSTGTSQMDRVQQLAQELYPSS
jgi:hypothetical protein